MIPSTDRAESPPLRSQEIPQEETVDRDDRRLSDGIDWLAPGWVAAP